MKKPITRFHADLALLTDCSHSVAFERTDIFLVLARQFFDAAFTGNAG